MICFDYICVEKVSDTRETFQETLKPDLVLVLHDGLHIGVGDPVAGRHAATGSNPIQFH